MRRGAPLRVLLKLHYLPLQHLISQNGCLEVTIPNFIRELEK